MEETILKQFSEKKNKEKVQDFYEKTLSILTQTLEELRQTSKNPTLDSDDTRIFPIGDYTNDTFIDQTGELEIVVATSNPQIIIANRTYVKNLSQTKKKKEKEYISKKGTFDEIILDFANTLAKHFDETSVIMIVNQGVKVLCLQEYGFKILIRFATYSADDENAVLNIWDPLFKTQTKVNLFFYNEKMEEKDKVTKGNYKKLVRIYKNIRKTILMNKWAYSSDINKYFIELIIYNIPNSIMMDGDINMLFSKSLCYLLNCNPLSFVDFAGNSIESFDLAKVSYSKIRNFLSNVSKITL